ncbi:MAG: isoprenylcysteine carboxylmethyltransferase family protein [Ignavibacteriae bacterium]|nr:MAG: isoprenylcysteine carboxylmethyltransferase family protein [Ignavibacteriota bacterium]
MKRIKIFIKSFIGIFFFILILFLSAGRMDYYQGWIFSAVSLLGLLMNFAPSNVDTELLDERSKPPKDAKQWDKLILLLSSLTTIIAYVLAGLDSGRYQWSPQFPWSIYILGIVLMFIGQLLFLKAKKTNRFFSSVMRIQNDRGHTVCETGPYRFVRHPGYLGMIFSWLAFPLLLGSVWSIIPIVPAIILLLVRTSLEDKTLMNELTGYSQYAINTRYRLIPWIW